MYVNSSSLVPANPVEIDDAPHVEEIGRNDYYVEVHIADGGLLRGTDVVKAARQQGWSEYNPDGTHRLMLPRGITQMLDLDKKTAVGAPAITVSFGVSKASSGKIIVGDVDLEQTRIMCEGRTYDQFRTMCKEGDPQAMLLVRAAKLLLWHSGRQYFSRIHFGSDVIAQYMKTVNAGVAKKFKDGPYLFRNQSEEALAQWKDPEEREFFRRMNIAFYNGQALGHDSMQLSGYCHFSSPLRRFPDLANHINLRDISEGREPTYSAADIDEIAREMTLIFMRRSSYFRKLKKAAA
jgi:exoribonuclease R